MRHVHILCIATESIFTETINIFKSYFRSLGFHVTYEYAFRVRHKMGFSKDINIVIKAQRHFEPDDLPKESLKILFQTEQYAKLRQFSSLPHQKNWDLILDVFQDNVERTEAASPAVVKFFPIGYDSEYQFPDQVISFTNRELPQDVYFFGARSKYRIELWNRHVKDTIYKARFANTDYEITKYMNILRTKVNVFMPAWEPYFLPTMHIMQVLANGKFLLVVSDTSQDFEPYQAGRHFAVTTSEEFRYSLEKYVTKESFRMSFEQKMYKNITTNHKFSDYLDEALKGYI